jgi:hypothetical protein
MAAVYWRRLLSACLQSKIREPLFLSECETGNTTETAPRQFGGAHLVEK